MAKGILRDQKMWFGGYDLTGVMNALGLDHSAEMKDTTVFGEATRTRLGGLKLVAASHQGYFDAAAMDSILFDNIGVADVPMSFGPVDGVEGSTAYTFLAVLGQYSPGGAVGDMFSFSVNAESSGDLVRGTLMHNAARAATANGTGRQLGAVAAGSKMYAALHVVAAGGTLPTLDVTVESDSASGFATPSTRMTFAQKTAQGFEWQELAGAITDDWWRVTWTVGGTTPSFTFAVILGIL